MGEIMSMYEDYQDIVKIENSSDPHISDKTSYLYIFPGDNKNRVVSTIQRKCVKRRRIVTSFGNSDYNEMPSNFEVNIDTEVDSEWGEQLIMSTNDDASALSITTQSSSYIQENDMHGDLNEFEEFRRDHERSLLNDENNLPFVISWYTKLIRIMHNYKTALRLKPLNLTNEINSKDLIRNINKKFIMSQINILPDKGLNQSQSENIRIKETNFERPIIWNCQGLVNCFLDQKVIEGIQIPPRECLNCRLYEADKGSNDDLLKWSLFNRLLHQRKQESFDVNNQSSVSPCSTEGLYFQRYTSALSPVSLEGTRFNRRPGNTCCSDSEVGREKRFIPYERKTYKKKKTKTDEDEGWSSVSEDEKNEKKQTKISRRKEFELTRPKSPGYQMVEESIKPSDVEDRKEENNKIRIVNRNKKIERSRSKYPVVKELIKPSDVEDRKEENKKIRIVNRNKKIELSRSKFPVSKESITTSDSKDKKEEDKILSIAYKYKKPARSRPKSPGTPFSSESEDKHEKTIRPTENTTQIKILPIPDTPFSSESEDRHEKAIMPPENTSQKTIQPLPFSTESEDRHEKTIMPAENRSQKTVQPLPFSSVSAGRREITIMPGENTPQKEVQPLPFSSESEDRHENAIMPPENTSQKTIQPLPFSSESEERQEITIKPAENISQNNIQSLPLSNESEDQHEIIVPAENTYQNTIQPLPFSSESEDRHQKTIMTAENASQKIIQPFPEAKESKTISEKEVKKRLDEKQTIVNRAKKTEFNIRKSGTSRLTDSESEREKRLMQNENFIQKKKRIQSVVKESMIKKSDNEGKKDEDKKLTIENRYKKPARSRPKSPLVASREKNSLAVANNVQASELLDKKQDKTMDSVKVTKTLKAQISLNREQTTNKRPKSDTVINEQKNRKLVRTTVLKSNENSSQDEGVNLNKNLENADILKSNNHHSVYFATVEEPKSLDRILSLVKTSRSIDNILSGVDTGKSIKNLFRGSDSKSKDYFLNGDDANKAINDLLKVNGSKSIEHLLNENDAVKSINDVLRDTSKSIGYLRTEDDARKSINDLINDKVDIENQKVTVTTFKKSLHTKRIKECSKSVFKKTVIKIEKNKCNNQIDSNDFKLIKADSNRRFDKPKLNSTISSGERLKIKKQFRLCTEEDSSSQSVPSTNFSFKFNNSTVSKVLKKKKAGNVKPTSANVESIFSRKSSTFSDISEAMTSNKDRLHVLVEYSTPVLKAFADQVQKSRQSCSTSKFSTTLSDVSDVTLNNGSTFDFLRPICDRRVKTSPKQPKKRRLSRPRTVSNATSSCPPSKMSETEDSSTSSAQQPSMRMSRPLEKPLTRKPVHFCPASMKRAENEFSDSVNSERASKNKYTIKTIIPSETAALKSKSKDLKGGQDDPIKTITVGPKRTDPQAFIDKLGNSLEKDINQTKKKPSKMSLISKNSKNSDKSLNFSEEEKAKSIDTQKLPNPQELHKSYIKPKNENNSELKEKWNKFSAPGARIGHPLKRMTLAEYQEKRRRSLKRNKDNIEEPPYFVTSSKIAGIFKIWEKDENKSKHASSITLESTDTQSKTNSSDALTSSTRNSSTPSTRNSSTPSTRLSSTSKNEKMKQPQTFYPPWNYGGPNRSKTRPRTTSPSQKHKNSKEDNKNSCAKKKEENE